MMAYLQRLLTMSAKSGRHQPRPAQSPEATATDRPIGGLEVHETSELPGAGRPRADTPTGEEQRSTTSRSIEPDNTNVTEIDPPGSSPHLETEQPASSSTNASIEGSPQPSIAPTPQEAFAASNSHAEEAGRPTGDPSVHESRSGEPQRGRNEGIGKDAAVHDRSRPATSLSEATSSASPSERLSSTRQRNNGPERPPSDSKSGAALERFREVVAEVGAWIANPGTAEPAVEDVPAPLQESFTRDPLPTVAPPAVRAHQSAGAQETSRPNEETVEVSIGTINLTVEEPAAPSVSPNVRSWSAARQETPRSSQFRPSRHYIRS